MQLDLLRKRSIDRLSTHWVPYAYHTKKRCRGNLMIINSPSYSYILYQYIWVKMAVRTLYIDSFVNGLPSSFPEQLPFLEKYSTKTVSYQNRVGSQVSRYCIERTVKSFFRTHRWTEVKLNGIWIFYCLWCFIHYLNLRTCISLVQYWSKTVDCNAVGLQRFVDWAFW